MPLPPSLLTAARLALVPTVGAGPVAAILLPAIAYTLLRRHLRIHLSIR